MSKTFLFAAIYRTNFVENTHLKVILSPVKIEVFPGPKRYKVPFQVAHKFPDSEERTVSKIADLSLEEGQYYVEITAQTKTADPIFARKECEGYVDNTTTWLGTAYGPYFLDSLVYKGWLIRDEWGVIDNWILPAKKQKVAMNGKELTEVLERSKHVISSEPDLSIRFSLMSRFFSKSLSFDMSEEKFLLLWTILEIYPMKSTTNIKPISSCLSEIMKKDADIIKTQLGIGELYGFRSQLVHNGTFDIDMKLIETSYDKEREQVSFHHQSEILGKLECIVHEILRFMCGMPYSGLLDKYIK